MNPFQQPPKISDKVPVEAQLLLQHPQAIQELRQHNGFQLFFMFYTSMPFMLRPEDITATNKNLQKIGILTAGALAAGVLVNIQVKRISMSFLKWPLYARVPVRVGIMALPFALLASPLTARLDEIFQLMVSVNVKKNKLVKTGDLEEYFGVAPPKPVDKNRRK